MCIRDRVIRAERFDAFAVTEPGAGSDPSAGTSTATRTDGGWLLNGEKWFVTCGDIADFLLVQADAGPDKLPTLFFVCLLSPSSPSPTSSSPTRTCSAASATGTS